MDLNKLQEMGAKIKFAFATKRYERKFGLSQMRTLKTYLACALRGQPAFNSMFNERDTEFYVRSLLENIIYVGIEAQFLKTRIKKEKMKIHASYSIASPYAAGHTDLVIINGKGAVKLIVKIVSVQDFNFNKKNNTGQLISELIAGIHNLKDSSPENESDEVMALLTDGRSFLFCRGCQKQDGRYKVKQVLDQSGLGGVFFPMDSDTYDLIDIILSTLFPELNYDFDVKCSIKACTASMSDFLAKISRKNS